MQEYKIELLIFVGGFVLTVYHSTAKCYQFSVVDAFGSVFDCDDIFYTVEAAERKGRQVVNELAEDKSVN